MKVVLTREPPRNDTLRKILELAVDVVEIPATETVYIPVADVVAACRLTPRTVVVTSARAVAAATELIQAVAPETVIAVGPTTASHLRERGVENVQTADDEGASALEGLTFAGPVVSVGASSTRPELGRLLEQRGLEAQHLSAYVTHGRTLSDSEINHLQEADFVVVAAPSAWSVVGPHVAPRASVVARGATTSSAVADSHHDVVVASSDTATVATILGKLLEA